MVLDEETRMRTTTFLARAGVGVLAAALVAAFAAGCASGQ